MLEFTVLSWNLFHGRDFPPNAKGKVSAWRLSGRPTDGGSYLNVNRSLLEEFAAVIGKSQWSVCLLQEAPPAWADRLAEQSGAEAFCSLTSRNQLAPLTRWIARRRPDLIGSWEGGSNTTLVRPPWQIAGDGGRSLLLNPLRERCLAERRRMAFVSLRNESAPEGCRELCVANLHAGQRARLGKERQVLRAAKAALDWAAGAPLLFGGDFNLSPRSSPALFEHLEREFGLAAPTTANAIDHVLARGLRAVLPPRRWPEALREVEVGWKEGKRRIRLSDHAPIEAVFAIQAPRIR